jgi:hypothetical protein
MLREKQQMTFFASAPFMEIDLHHPSVFQEQAESTFASITPAMFQEHWLIW